jgi:hypothetical protein
MMPEPTTKSETPLLDAIVAEHDADPVAFAAAHDMTEIGPVMYIGPPPLPCRWKPCTFILFGQKGETHEQYHERKGYY